MADTDIALSGLLIVIAHTPLWVKQTTKLSDLHSTANGYHSDLPGFQPTMQPRSGIFHVVEIRMLRVIRLIGVNSFLVGCGGGVRARGAVVIHTGSTRALVSVEETHDGGDDLPSSLLNMVESPKTRSKTRSKTREVSVEQESRERKLLRFIDLLRERAWRGLGTQNCLSGLPSHFLDPLSFLAR